MNASVQAHTSSPYILDASFAANPWSHYEKMRQEGPISLTYSPSGIPFWLVTDQATARYVLSDHVFKRDIQHIATIFERHEQIFFLAQQQDDPKGLEAHMLNRDTPDHSRLRKIAVKAFTPRAISRHQQRINEITRQLIHKLPTDVPFDIGKEFSYPLPVTMICEILGLPPGAEREQFTRWSHVLLNRIDNNDFTEFMNVRDRMFDKLDAAIKYKRQRLIDYPPDDILDEIILARDNDDKLSEREVISTAFLLLVAGHETTVTLINNAIIHLCTHPDLAEELRQDSTLIPNFIEEILRVHSPVQFSAFRYNSEPVIIGDQKIAKDELFVVSLLAANHDPAIYPNPDEILLGRKASHLAFGHGPHFCLGSHLARSEAQIAIANLLQSFSHMTLAVAESELTWRSSGVVRTRDTVPIILERS